EYLHLCDWSGNAIMVFDFFPNWKLQDVRGGVGSILAGTELKGRILTPVPKSRQFRIRVNSQGGLSLGVGQVEVIVLEVEDVTDRVSVLYKYEGSGLTLSVPGGKGVGAVGGFVKRAHGVMGAGSVSSVGPWNDFEVPGWVCAYDFEGPASAGSPYSLGFGTETSWSTFSFGNNGGKPMVSFGNFGTGQTFGLPSAGLTMGSMTLLSQRRQH
ncbi:MAG: hypothetical protein L6R30_23970, partial [Thermoanaerobaculia bacterium]|nr:hypothetical protein [Thermoanaerobaculia bacterium]